MTVEERGIASKASTLMSRKIERERLLSSISNENKMMAYHLIV